MKVFIAGATGVIGRPLTRQLIAANHEIIAMTRSDQRTAQLRQLGATPVVCDVFDQENLRRYIEDAQRGASNTKAKRALKWSPTYSTWRSGFGLVNKASHSH